MTTQSVVKSKPRPNLPNRLRSLRIAKGLTLRELAEYLDVSVQAVNKAELLGEGINRAKWYALATLFEIDPRLLETPENI